MYRERLKSSAGCMRCKQRHRKCDEQRPRCSFCARHHLTCIWPTVSQPRRSRRTQLATIVRWQSSIPRRDLAHIKDVSSLDPFHNLPVHYSDGVDVMTTHLRNFFMRIAENALPFDVANTHRELTHGWLASIHSDEAVCSSFVTYCAWFYSERTARRDTLTNLCLRSEARTLALLRHRVENDETVTEGTLLAAALQFFIATFNTKSVHQLSQIAHGVSALVTAKGGSKATIHAVSPSTRQSLIFVDVFNSLLSAQKPLLEIEIPPRPPSFDLLFTRSTIDKVLANCLGQDLVDVLGDLRFALFFRTPSQQSRSLSSTESWYLFMLLQKISYGLCIQQSRLKGSRSMAEIAVYGMILVKEQVLLDIVQHPIMPITILRRLRSAVSKLNFPLQEIDSTVTLWASMMTLMGTEFENERTWALEFINRTLTGRYGPAWPQDWAAQLRQELQCFLWHNRIEVAFKTICTQVCHLHGHIDDHMI